MHKRGEPHIPALAGCFTYAVQPHRRAGPALSPGRGRWPAFLLAARLPSWSPADGGVDPSPLFGSFLGTMQASDFSSWFLGLRPWAFPKTPFGHWPISGADETSQFLCEGLRRMRRVSDRVEPSGSSRLSLPSVPPSAQHNSVGAPESPIVDGRPMMLEVVEKGWPVGLQAMLLKIAQRKGKSVVDADQRRHILGQPLDQPLGDAAPRPVFTCAGRW
jgi:hypothetical protein